MLAIFLLASIGSAFDLSSTSPSPGDKITLTGTTSPGEMVSFHSSFSMDLPVTGGEYSYETQVNIPQKPNRFAVTARNVQDFNAGVRLGIWITRRFEASGGSASISQADVPPGTYDLKLFGQALPGSTDVPVEVVAETQVMPDSEGKYSLVIDTTGIPAGEYRIEGAGDAQTIRIGGPSPTSELSSSSQGKEDRDSGSEITPAEQNETQVEITSAVVQWYANKTGLGTKNKSQYDEAEKLLKSRLSGGYWKIIRQGEPLTEVAGNCEQEYCLVRGIDACKECREKDISMLQKENKSSDEPDILEKNVSAVSQNLTEPRASKPGQEKSFISRVMDWIWQLLGMGQSG